MPKAVAAQMQTYFGKGQKYKWNHVIREDFRNVPVYFVVGRITDDYWKATGKYGLVYEVFSRNITTSGKLYTSSPYSDDYVIEFEFKDLNSDGANEIIVNDEDESNQGIEIFALTQKNEYRKIFTLGYTMDTTANDRFLFDNEKTHEFVDINGDGLMELVVYCPCYKFKDNKYLETQERTYQIYKKQKRTPTAKKKAINLLSFLHKNITWYADSAILLDLNNDGKQDVALCGVSTDHVHVAIVLGPVNKTSIIKTESFPIGTIAQNSVCKPYVTLEKENLTPVDKEAGELKGIDKSGKSDGFKMVDGACDDFHFFWDYKSQSLAWWRL